MTTAPEMLKYGLVVTLVGMGIVFLVLIGLSFMLDALKLISKKGTPKSSNEIIRLENKEEIVENTVDFIEDDEELVAVISAAIASFMGNDSKLIVRSIHRVEGNNPAWAKVARQEQMLTRI